VLVVAFYETNQDGISNQFWVEVPKYCTKAANAYIGLLSQEDFAIDSGAVTMWLVRPRSHVTGGDEDMGLSYRKLSIVSDDAGRRRHSQQFKSFQKWLERLDQYYSTRSSKVKPSLDSLRRDAETVRMAAMQVISHDSLDKISLLQREKYREMLRRQQKSIVNDEWKRLTEPTTVVLHEILEKLQSVTGKPRLHFSQILQPENWRRYRGGLVIGTPYPMTAAYNWSDGVDR
jgi:hypothetical protein